MKRSNLDAHSLSPTMSAMVRCGVVAVIALLVFGCESGGSPRSRADEAMFGAATIRIHPTFTQVRDWNNDKKNDGIEALLEIQDQFGEPTRASGRVMFELYDYRRNSPEIRGRRIGGPWIFPLDTRQAQVDHWNSALPA